jgi:hypothetical protein
MSGKYTRLVRDLLLFGFFVEVVDLESACAYASSMIENEASRRSGTVAHPDQLASCQMAFNAQLHSHIL